MPFKENLHEKIWFGLILFLGLIFIFLVPPFQKPDEIEHFYRSVGLIHRNIQSDGYSIYINKRFYNLPIKLQADNVRWKYNNKFDWKLLDIVDKDNSLVKYSYDFFGVDFVGYVMSAWGILLGSLFSNPVIAFYLGRFFNFLFFVFCLFFSLKIIPKNFRLILLFFASIPMVLHQATAISYDAIGLSLIVLIFSVFLKFVFEEKISLKNYLMFILLLLVFVIIKYGYWFMFLLFWIVPYKKIKGKYWWPVVLSVLSLIGFFLFKNNYFAISMGLRPKLVLGDFYSFQQDILPKHPDIFLVSVWNTINTMGRNYIEMLIGVLGWLDYRLGFGIYLLYIYVYFLIINFISKKDFGFNFGKLRVTGLILILCSVALSVFAGMYFYESQPGEKLIPGQGRYFLVLIPFLTFVLILFFKWIRQFNLKFIGLGLVIVLLLVNIIFSIKNRYYDYSDFIDKPNYLEAKWKNYDNDTKAIKNENYLVDSKFTYNLDFNGSSNQIRGFEFAFTSNKKAVNIPYLFFIKDKDCNKVLDSGFLDQRQLITDGIYRHNLGSKKFEGDGICLWIEPYYKNDRANYLSIVKSEGEFFVRLLNPRQYLLEETKYELSLKKIEKVTVENPIYQTFRSNRNNLSGIGILTTTFDQYNSINKYKLTLYDEKCFSPIKEIQINNKELEDGEFTDFIFDPVNDSQDKKYCFSISMLEGDPLLGIYFSDKNLYSLGDSTVGEKKMPTDAVFRLMYK